MSKINSLQDWKNFKRSGSYRRRVQLHRKQFLAQLKTNVRKKSVNNHDSYNKNSRNVTELTSEKNVLPSTSEKETDEKRQNSIVDDEIATISDNITSSENYSCVSLIKTYERDLKNWATENNITHTSLKQLLQILNKYWTNGLLPTDPRTFLNTASTKLINIVETSNGKYWYNGLEHCLKQYFECSTTSLDISLNINIDGLPLFNGSKMEFWPILFNIYEIPFFSPMIISIYCGSTKPSSLENFLNPFVKELKNILIENNGIVDINDNCKIKLKIRCFICDAPARAFIKGVANFNGQFGCHKCCTIGEYSHVSHCNIFPRIDCEKRTDAGFRAKLYGRHHKGYSPLEELPIDMIEDFPVGDSLHLIDLGVMKRLLIGWRGGNFSKYDTKWSAKQIFQISSFLTSCRLPSEIHRTVRGLDTISFWKATEFRSFLYYISIVILKEFLPNDAYQHYLLFFCAITILSSEIYLNVYGLLAKQLLNLFIEYYRDVYGEDHITSNVHNLTHVVDEAKKFGILQKFNAYPFESKLFQIKRLLRTGNHPLSQAARRISEIEQHKIVNFENIADHRPLFKQPQGFYYYKSQQFPLYKNIQFKNFSLNCFFCNKWFLTKTNDIICFKGAFTTTKDIKILGAALNSKQNFFETPIKSSYLNIYESDCTEGPINMYNSTDIKCKLVSIKFTENQIIFIPLLHTL